jgi:hypothetical protein
LAGEVTKMSSKERNIEMGGSLWMVTLSWKHFRLGHSALFPVLDSWNVTAHLRRLAVVRLTFSAF